eukprot:m.207816 g.207816  ORF g.207816 m.207816 type:complete len:615 (+) comp23944_c0_seq1:69-1913(+)
MAAKAGSPPPAHVEGLLGGEIVVASVERVLRYNASVLASGDYGELHVTNYRLVFVGAESSEVCTAGWLPPEEENRSIPLTSIANLYSTVRGSSTSVFQKQRVPLTTSVRMSTIDGIEVTTKDCFVHRFGVQFVNGPDATSGGGGGGRGTFRRRHTHSKDSPLKKLIHTLLQYASPTMKTKFFVFDYAPSGKRREIDVDAETLKYKTNEHAAIKAERARCGIRDDTRWYIAQNLQFLICPSYPALFVVPSAVSGDHLVAAGKMGWEDGRLPIWRWSHRATGAWVARSTRRISSDPEVMELVKAYDEFGDIVEIDAHEAVGGASQVEVAFTKLSDACCSAETDEVKGVLDSAWHATFHDTRWPQLLQKTLAAARLGAEAVQGGTNVMVLGTTDSLVDAVVCSLIQVIVDEYRRTRRGFNELIKSEWESLGFPLVDGALSSDPKRKNQHVLFTLFLDAVYQVMAQFPLRFEFTDTYLVHMWRSSFSGLYSTFTFTTEKERLSREFFAATSFWDENALPQPTADTFWHPFTNVLYSPTDLAVLPDASEVLVRLWSRCYLPQSAGRQTQDEDAVRQHVHNRLVRLGEALRTKEDPEDAAERLGLPRVLAAVVASTALSG